MRRGGETRAIKSLFDFFMGQVEIRYVHSVRGGGSPDLFARCDRVPFGRGLASCSSSGYEKTETWAIIGSLLDFITEREERDSRLGYESLSWSIHL